MLRTIIADSYRENEKNEIVGALGTVCNANDNYGWASSGIYCYWDYESREILYVGLAIDLTERFKQHNGMFPGIDLNTCKRREIDEYFRQKERIGFSVVLQSCLSQPATRNVEKRFEGLFTRIPNARDIGADGKAGIQRLEGVLLEAFKKANRTFPKWNKIGGSIKGQLSVKNSNIEAFSLLNATTMHYLLSRSTLREIAAKATLERYENFLHAARIIAPIVGFEMACQVIASTDMIGTFNHMVAEGYHEKVLQL
ncbi:hypothetical protein FFJ24_021245 [Pedobacter sp. KBS0701]|uniref:hypothetical protein n=1 Tax=Pedobacter sp. KBS0701 TaxID=2578106 RepID=UPI00110DDB14|nr:hypothetical protein [Pedobacter sp. KBS0701]QDW27214.1 hypothetical protein FFJ24_021245 [Pedobacter sp. KBS0701]